MTTDGGGWTRCYTAGSGNLGWNSWQMPGNSCFGGNISDSELLVRGSNGADSYIKSVSSQHGNYQQWCKSEVMNAAVGLGVQPGKINYWNGSVCYIGGNNDNGSNPFYSWTHGCGGNQTIFLGVTHGSGCDTRGWVLGDLWIFYR
jgi:hypothetical protein